MRLCISPMYPNIDEFRISSCCVNVQLEMEKSARMKIFLWYSIHLCITLSQISFSQQLFWNSLSIFNRTNDAKKSTGNHFLQDLFSVWWMYSFRLFLRAYMTFTIIKRWNNRYSLNFNQNKTINLKQNCIFLM